MKDRTLLIYIVLSAVVAALFYFSYYGKKQTVLSNLKAERTKIEAEVSRLRLKKTQMDQIERELQTLGSTLSELEAIIPQKKEISNILSQFQTLAYDSRLNITKFTPRGETAREFYAEWPIPIEVTGNYHNLGLFFDRLSRFSRLFVIERFLIKGLTRQTDATTISASFTSKTFIFMENPPETKEEPNKAAAKKAR